MRGDGAVVVGALIIVLVVLPTPVALEIESNIPGLQNNEVKSEEI